MSKATATKPKGPRPRELKVSRAQMAKIVKLNNAVAAAVRERSVYIDAVLNGHGITKPQNVLALDEKRLTLTVVEG